MGSAWVVAKPDRNRQEFAFIANTSKVIFPSPEQEQNIILHLKRIVLTLKIKYVLPQYYKSFFKTDHR